MNAQFLLGLPGPAGVRRPSGSIAWPLALLFCGYFLFACWPAIQFISVFLTLLAGLGLTSPFLILLLRLGWCVIVAVIVGAISLTVAKQFVDFKDRYRRLVNLFLLVVTIGFLPPALFELFLLLYRPVFHLYGKVNQ